MEVFVDKIYIILIYKYQHLIHGAVPDPTNGVTHSVREEEDSLRRGADFAPPFEIFDSGSVGSPVVAPDDHRLL